MKKSHSGIYLYKLIKNALVPVFYAVFIGNAALFPVYETIAAENSNFSAVPPVASVSVLPNVLIILDNSNSMDEDVDGTAVGSDSPLSRSEIARNAVEEIIAANKDTMRFGLMAYDQTNVIRQYLNDSFYYCSYDPATYDPTGVPTPKDPTTNTKRFPNPSSPGNFIYYDTALPLYTGANSGNWFCYSGNYTENGNSNNDNYNCYHTKTGTAATPTGLAAAALGGYGYATNFYNGIFVPTDEDIAAGFTEFGYENAAVPVGWTWFTNTSPGGGRLHVNVADSTAAQVTALNNKLATSQFVNAVDTPLRNAGLTPLAGTMASASRYFRNLAVPAAAGVAATNPITAKCQKNYVILVTDGLPSTNSLGQAGTADALLPEVEANIAALRATTNPAFAGTTFDIKTYVVGFAIPPTLGSKLDALAVAGGTDDNGKALLANNAAELAAKLKSIFLQISSEASSGTAAVINTNSKAGVGGVFMSMFYPELKDTTNNKITWAGSINSLFVDEKARLREDTNSNAILDDSDRIITFQQDASGTITAFSSSVSALAETTDIVLPGPATLGGSYLVLNSIDEAFYVWFNVDGASTDPHPTGIATGIQVAIASTASATDVAAATATAIDAFGPFHASVESGSTVRIINTVTGVTPDAISGTAGTAGVAMSIHQQGSGEAVVAVATGTRSDVKFLWDSTDWLNSITDTDITTQRSYSAVEKKRHIFTFIDADKDMIADTGEQLDFTVPSLPTVGQLKDAATLYPYIPVHSNSTTLPATITGNLTDALTTNDGNLAEFLSTQTQRVVNYIRGNDQPEVTLSDTTTILPAFRSRKIQRNGVLETWRLGDVVSSNPLAVDRPRQNLHQIYRDTSYGEFIEKYSSRRTVIYSGGNDGMLHAFNAGFYEDRYDVYPTGTPDFKKDIQYLLQPKKTVSIAGVPTVVTDTSLSAHPLGAELWAYVPYNLLPHLYWLTEKTYNHVYYVDLEPVAYDAKIFTPDADHPHGWGTILVGGMRFGGGTISVDMDRTDGTVNGADRTMSSAYYILDITNPENPPVVLAEMNFPHQGYTTNLPTMAVIKDKTPTGLPENNQWYLIFGSGPAEASGIAGPYGSDSLTKARSNQKAKLYVVDLAGVAKDKKIRTLDPSGAWVDNTAPYYYQNFTADQNAYISDIISTDYDLDYKTDALYFGTTSFTNATGTDVWGGKLRRIVVDNQPNPLHWDGDSVFFDLESSRYQPLSAAVNTTMDTEGNVWVFFGTGRYLVRDDLNITALQSLYGIKEPRHATSGLRSYAQVAFASLFNATDIEVNASSKLVSGGGWSSASWSSFINGTKPYAGWYVNLTDSRERIIYQAALSSNQLKCTSYVPSNDVCEYMGGSYLYDLYYLTGTAAWKAVLTDPADPTPTNFTTRVSLGKGLASRPTIHLNEEGTSTVFVQRSDGTVTAIEENPTGTTKSGKQNWQQRQ